VISVLIRVSGWLSIWKEIRVVCVCRKHQDHLPERYTLAVDGVKDAAYLP
jgi:hypothetical protein